MLNEQAKHFISPDDRFKLILSVYLVFLKDGKVLLLRRQNTGYEDGNYGVPSGHADGDEPARMAACREGQEEAGIQLHPTEILPSHFMHRRQADERFDIFFTVKEWEGEPKNTEPEECDDLSWFPLDNLPTNTIPYIRQAIECIQKNEVYSEFGWKGNA